MTKDIEKSQGSMTKKTPVTYTTENPALDSRGYLKFWLTVIAVCVAFTLLLSWVMNI